jgi:phosphoglycerate dehydrogenase-like enzyme
VDRVLVASKSFGYGAEEKQVNDLFRRYDLAPAFAPLTKAGGEIYRARGLIIGTDKITESLFLSAKRLKVIVKYGVGIDNIDMDAARRHGVQVLNLPGINSTTVAEMALGLMLAIARKIPAGDRSVRGFKWEGFIGTSVLGKTLGIIGTGSIGCALAKLVSGMGMPIIGFDPIENPVFLAAGGKYVDKQTILASSDFLSLHLPMNAQTRHFVNAEMLSQMKQGAILINTSRGGIVDEDALIAALSSGRLGGAALDVFEEEPPSRKELLSMENAVFTPHISAYTEENLRRMDEACVAVLSKALMETASEGKPE